ncbi:hypothetical protein BpHYR1_001414 [Brachionus plicatilis]|uniref:Uncharacterized protein n=1 Tax=Brachionus plicatilis TaxID=10195 RepID=A0A3M7RWX0_BRAPC|nr:hypothetical protein BpHYR1_001414 [Brachionus plicatilis]
MFKLIKGINEVSWVNPPVPASSLSQPGPAGGIRGHARRLSGQASTKCLQRTNTFTNRIVNEWNALYQHLKCLFLRPDTELIIYYYPVETTGIPEWFTHKPFGYTGYYFQIIDDQSFYVLIYIYLLTRIKMNTGAPLQSLRGTIKKMDTKDRKI